MEPHVIAIRAHPHIKGLRIGLVTEVLSLYADNMLLYLEDAGPSIVVALQVIKQSREYSGLQINWSKSQILPLDIDVPTADQAVLPLIRASRIKYLSM